MYTCEASSTEETSRGLRTAGLIDISPIKLNLNPTGNEFIRCGVLILKLPEFYGKFQSLVQWEILLYM